MGQIDFDKFSTWIDSQHSSRYLVPSESKDFMRTLEAYLISKIFPRFSGVALRNGRANEDYRR